MKRMETKEEKSIILDFLSLRLKSFLENDCRGGFVRGQTRIYTIEFPRD